MAARVARSRTKPRQIPFDTVVRPATPRFLFATQDAERFDPAAYEPMSRKHSQHGASAATGPSQRMLRVGELIRHKLAEMLVRGEIHDDVLASHVITISEVRMSPDLKLATAYVMPLGGKDIAPVIEALTRNRRFIRGEIAHAVNLRAAPDIRFREDASFEEATRIDRLLHSEKVRRDVEKK
jgi:ribosome-binding factor A